MNNLSILTNQSTIKSTELVDIINEFRRAEEDENILQHKDFMKKVRKEIETLKNLNLGGQGNFSQSYYINSQNKKQPCFELNRDGMLQMLNSESTYVRYKTIEYINKLEEKIKLPATYKEALIQLVQAEEEKEQLQLEKLKIEEEKKINEPKIHYHDWILNSPSLIPITAIAKDYGMTAELMNKTLKDLKVQFKMGEQWILYRKYDSEGYTSTKPLVIKHKTKPTEVKNQTQWTQKGKEFIYNLLKEQGILPLIERDAI
ncbi:phage antirepressor KilAC domain-containing protein [Clostridium saccharoperbutylacetonicum]|uniref:phage antirepressor KilAC domain-containing protein n=1 Tax=Clostridium saccharoperbutylacetonicum TaxID=36745 RepID=UPI000983ED59|nr:phage antirepressor KilAC domain-containing protein [Clostridium saccharoperbutylacetonicum]AQR95521.1 phage antirepressor protein KilAC domain protein [Clostridium saccharoperbutylacetonicum]NSB31381.1 phage antirepressor YoqD-like protein [Clostridium saccharoperbutylacetonicum]